VSFAARGNLILLAPPLVIERADLDAALDLLDRLLLELETETAREMETP
jgi:taurine--2-oxoglutarate transaminase